MSESINQIFKSAVIKYLSEVDCPKHGSNQHEIGGLVKSGFSRFLGEVVGSQRIPFATWFVRLEDEEDPIAVPSQATWYNARNRVSEKRGPEYRLYYKSNDVTDLFHPGDFMLLAMTEDSRLLLITAPANSQSEREVRMLFNAADTEAGRLFARIELDNDRRDLPLSMLLSNATGLPLFYVPEENDDWLLEKLLDICPDVKPEEGGPATKVFPKTSAISGLVHALFKADPGTDPDLALELWMGREDRLFHLLEEHLVQERLRAGFRSVEEFSNYSLSFQNRRKSRAGHAFENHLAEIFTQCGLQFEAQALTEAKKRPDFLFPCAAAYHDSGFPSARLRMLGAKTTCKDRWRQIISEADRIPSKHLVTLQQGISDAQISEMHDSSVRLVIPASIRETYADDQRSRIMTLSDFIDEVREIQR